MPLTLSITYTEERKGWMLGMSKITWSHMEVSKLLLPDPGSPPPPTPHCKRDAEERAALTLRLALEDALIASGSDMPMAMTAFW